MVLIWIVCLTCIWLGIVTAYRLPVWKFPSPKIFYVLGFGLFGAGVAFRWYSIHYLGRFFTPNVTIVADHRLIDSGPYRFIRHPTYSGMLLILLGLGLSLGNIASMLIVFVPIFIALAWRIRIEEKVLLKAFGEQYRSYVERTRRLIPLIY